MEDNERGKLQKPAAEGPGEEGGNIVADIYDWFDTILYSVLVIMVIFVLFTRMSTVDGDSMRPTLEDGQRLMITDFLYTPSYNDIVVVEAKNLPANDYSTTGKMGKAIVKRIIGLPGDTIDIDFDNGIVYRNGEALEQEEKNGIIYEDGHMINDYTHDRESFTGQITVPEGYIFVMGDNRNASTDSRHVLVGFIDRREMLGKAYLRITPFDKFGGLYG